MLSDLDFPKYFVQFFSFLEGPFISQHSLSAFQKGLVADRQSGLKLETSRTTPKVAIWKPLSSLYTSYLSKKQHQSKDGGNLSPRGQRAVHKPASKVGSHQSHLGDPKTTGARKRGGGSAGRSLGCFLLCRREFSYFLSNILLHFCFCQKIVFVCFCLHVLLLRSLPTFFLLSNL